MILDELRSSWLQYSDGELAAYDDYPTLVKMIMHVSGAKELVELQEALAEIQPGGEGTSPDTACSMEYFAQST